ncbi:MAG: glycogen/starch synthase [Myxococcota bacterium]
MARKLRILMASSEAHPWSGGGGLAESVSALAGALVARGHRVDLLVPHVPALMPRPSPPLEDLGALQLPVGGGTIHARLLTPAPDAALRPLLLAAPELYTRPGLYGEAGTDYTDNCTRFTALGRAANLVGAALRQRYDVLHCHDWPTGLGPYYSRETRAAGGAGAARCTVFTVHNAAYQGLFWPLDLPILGLGAEHYAPERLEFFGKLSFLKAGVVSADRVTTVSATYARELLSPEAGGGMDGPLRARGSAFVGVPTGIDAARWDPATDPHLPARYSDPLSSERRTCVTFFRQECGLPQDEHPVLAVVGPLNTQKGSDVLPDAAEGILAAGAHLAVLGSGDAALETALRELAARHAGRVAFQPGFDEGRIHRAVAGADFLLIPSRVEPAGQAPLAGQRYGTPAVARRTGALRDVVMDVDANPAQGTGITYVGEGEAPLLGAVARAVALRRDTARYQAAQKLASVQDVSCGPAAARYEQLYLEALSPSEPREKPA